MGSIIPTNQLLAAEPAWFHPISQKFPTELPGAGAKLDKCGAQGAGQNSDFVTTRSRGVIDDEEGCFYHGTGAG
jgi:hypothetical protein